MQKKHYLVLIILLISLVGFSQDSNFAFKEIRLGLGWGRFTNYSIQPEFEIKTKSSKSIAYLLELNYSKQNGTYFIGGIQSGSFAIWESFIYINLKWHPIRTKKQPFSLLFITSGIGYFNQNYSDGYRNIFGPSLKLGLGIQYTYRKLSFSLKSQFYYIYNFNHDDLSKIKFSGIPLMVSLGRRFKK